MVITDGARGLRAFLKANELTQKSAADALGVEPPTIHEWLAGTKRPSAHHRTAIEIWTHGEVDATDWLLRAERSAIAATKPFTATRTGT